MLVPKREPVLRQFGFVPLAPVARSRCWSAPTGRSRTAWSICRPGWPRRRSTRPRNYLTARLAGLTLAEARRRIAREIGEERAALDGAARALVERGLAVWSADGAARPVLIVRGQANLIDPQATADLDRVRGLLDELEGKEEIARLLDSARDGEAARIFIGSENKLFALSGSSVIAQPVRALDGRVVGVVGVIGPTRLNYARVVPMVDFTAATLARLLG